MRSKKVVVGVVAGVLTGVAAGALLGILFAPKKGSETREKINKLVGEFGNLAKDKFNDLLDGIIEKFENTSDEVSELTQRSEKKLKK
ncbi:MAG TPA: gas vesicle protein [Prolixibacteraceae bacterium]|nr:gas vesicle protein [Prolixibacteraceae bacterium]